jgi:hypothetical protein
MIAQKYCDDFGFPFPHGETSQVFLHSTPKCFLDAQLKKKHSFISYDPYWFGPLNPNGNKKVIYPPKRIITDATTTDLIS